MRKYLIVGLGNIGAEYHRTRHNIGFDILDAFAEASNIFFAPGRYADIAQTSVKGRKIILIKPTTFMNLSGKAVRYWMESEKIPLENVLVVVDEIALPLGLLRFKPKGSDGGHNGLKDIQIKLNTPNYPRLRVGIGSDYPKGHQVQFVLGKWTDEQWDQLQPKIKKSVEGITSFALQGLATTMNQFNG